MRRRSFESGSSGGMLERAILSPPRATGRRGARKRGRNGGVATPGLAVVQGPLEPARGAVGLAPLDRPGAALVFAADRMIRWGLRGRAHARSSRGAAVPELAAPVSVAPESGAPESVAPER